MYKIIIYYKVSLIANPKHEQRDHMRLCKTLNLKGRILISSDGINGTLAGTAEDIKKYVEYCNNHIELSDIDFKYDDVPEIPFAKLRIRMRDEIITTNVLDKFDVNDRAQYIDADTLHQWYKAGDDFIVLDMRNDYEWEVGRFKNSVRPPMKYFRDLGENLDFYKKYKDEKVVTFCTGGIRCEFATPQLFNIGFKPEDVYQLEGGIIKYAQKYGDGGYFEGKCFVFDNRIVIDVDKTKNAKVVGKCAICKNPNDIYRNCSNAQCNKLFLACDDCWDDLGHSCNNYCKAVIVDPTKIRPERVKVVHRNK